jgi:hypothetical protein
LAVKQPPGVFQQLFVGRGHRDLRLVAVEHKDIMFLLQLAYRVENRGRGQETLFGGAGKAATNSHREKGAQLDKVHDVHPLLR